MIGIVETATRPAQITLEPDTPETSLNPRGSAAAAVLQCRAAPKVQTDNPKKYTSPCTRSSFLPTNLEARRSKQTVPTRSPAQEHSQNIPAAAESGQELRVALSCRHHDGIGEAHSQLLFWFSISGMEHGWGTRLRSNAFVLAPFRMKRQRLFRRYHAAAAEPISP